MGTVDAEIKAPYVENLELLKHTPFQTGITSEYGFARSPTVENLELSKLILFKTRSGSEYGFACSPTADNL